MCVRESFARGIDSIGSLVDYNLFSSFECEYRMNIYRAIEPRVREIRDSKIQFEEPTQVLTHSKSHDDP